MDGEPAGLPTRSRQQRSGRWKTAQNQVTAQSFYRDEGMLATLKRSPRGKRRGQPANTQSLDDVVQGTFPLWRKHHLDYDQTKYVVERVRRRLALEPPRTRNRTLARLEPSEI